MAPLLTSAPINLGVNHVDYPLNLIRLDTRTFPSTLQKYKARLDAESESLCFQDESEICVPIRDVYEDSTWDKTNLRSEAELKQWIGVEATRDSLAPREEPKCRLM